MSDEQKAGFLNLPLVTCRLSLLIRRFDLKQITVSSDHAREASAPEQPCIIAQSRSPQFARHYDSPFRLQVCFHARYASDQMKRAQGLFLMARGGGYQAKQGYEKN